MSKNISSHCCGF